MSRTQLTISIFVLSAMLAAVFLAAVPAVRARRPDPGPVAPAVEKLIGPERCGECHRAEYESWRLSQHQKSFKAMHRSPEAKAIAKALGVKRIKSDPSCVRCHYTPVEKRGKVRAGHGVSCESCHGAAHDWLVVHDDFGGKEVTRELETKEHRAERAQRCRERGMRRPEDIHSLASECFACHVVSDENLINKTDHPIGQQFELLSWMQGEVRHNFLLSNGTKNAEPAPARKRLLYVMGALLDLEYGLRAYAVATTDGRYRVTMAQRVETAIEKVMVIDGKLEKHPFTGFCATLRETALAERSAETLIFLADQAQRLAQGLQAGPSLPAALDTLLPATEAYRGKSLVGH